MKFFYFTLIFLSIAINSYSQQYSQYFDGNDTIPSESMTTWLDTIMDSTWQIGPPQKIIFDSSYSSPNVIITDTINPYPNSDTSMFYISTPAFLQGGLYALRWTQKLDLDTNDMGRVEVLIDDGVNYYWDPISFNSGTSCLYSFYGFLNQNMGYTDSSYNDGFIGRDSTWRDIWLCFNSNCFTDSVTFRFILESDAEHNNGDGWMMDNFIFSETWTHTIKENSSYKNFRLAENPTSTIVQILGSESSQVKDIVSVIIYNSKGERVKTISKPSSDGRIKVDDLSTGAYIMKIHHQSGLEVHRVIIE